MHIFKRRKEQPHIKLLFSNPYLNKKERASNCTDVLLYFKSYDVFAYLKALSTNYKAWYIKTKVYLAKASNNRVWIDKDLGAWANKHLAIIESIGQVRKCWFLDNLYFLNT